MRKRGRILIINYSKYTVKNYDATLDSFSILGLLLLSQKLGNCFLDFGIRQLGGNIFVNLVLEC